MSHRWSHLLGRIAAFLGATARLRASQVAAATILLAGYQSGVAQQAGSATSAEAGSTQDTALAELVVTAQRRSQNIQDVPIAITVVNSDTLATLNIDRVDQIALVTPDLIFDVGFGFTETYIRGIGAAASPNVGLENPVANYIDGAYITRGVGTNFDLMDVASVEILKGPQGTLYGHNASGGAIIINTVDPTLDKASFSGRFESGSYEHALEETEVNLPVSDTLAFRVADRFQHDDGFVTDITTGQRVRGGDSYDARGKALWVPATDFSALLSFDYHYARVNAIASGRQSATAPFCVGCLFAPNPQAGFYQDTEDYQRFDPQHSYNGNLKLTYDLGKIHLKSVTDYRDLFAQLTDDSDHTPVPLFVYHSIYGGETFSEDLQASSDFGGPIEFLGGGQYIHDVASASTAIYGGLFGLPYSGSYVPAKTADGLQTVTTRSWSVFGEVYFKPFSQLTVTAGGRYTADSRHMVGIDNAAAEATLYPGGPLTWAQSASDSRFTPRAVIAYEFAPVSAYASFTKGFKSGGFNIPSFGPQTTPINPENIESYEVGVKFLSSDRRTRVNTAAFLYNYSDVQVSITNLSTQIIKNAASARGKGVEIDFDQKLAADWLTVSGGISYLDAYYTSFADAAAYVYARNPAGAIVGLVAGKENLSGSTLPRAPKWTMDLAANLNVPLPHGWTGRLSTVARYTDRYLFYPGAGGVLGADQQAGYTVLNMSGGISPGSEAYEVGFYIDNLTGRRYYENIETGTLAIDTIVAPPLTFGLRLKAKF